MFLLSWRRRLTWRLRALLTRLVCLLTRWRDTLAVRQQPVLVVQAANLLVAEMGIWQVSNTLDVKAHLARWHRDLSLYRGYLLCADPCGRTFLLDTRTWSYLTLTTASLLQIEGVEQARRFVDVLCHMQAS